MADQITVNRRVFRGFASAVYDDVDSVVEKDVPPRGRQDAPASVRRQDVDEHQYVTVAQNDGLTIVEI